MLVGPMADAAKEPTGSMGNDTPPAILSNHSQPLFNYFKQLFAQVTNPPLDAQWEKLVTSTETLLGARSNLFSETPEHARQLKLEKPIIKNRLLAQIKELNQNDMRSKVIDTTIELNDQLLSSTGFLKASLDRIQAEAEKAVDEQYTILILSDRNQNETHTAIPMLLAVGAVHHHLIRTNRRTQCDIVVETGDAREVHHFATLIGYGTGAINPYLAYESLHQLRDENVVNSEWDDATVDEDV